MRLLAICLALASAALIAGCGNESKAEAEHQETQTSQPEASQPTTSPPALTGIVFVECGLDFYSVKVLDPDSEDAPSTTLGSISGTGGIQTEFGPCMTSNINPPRRESFNLSFQFLAVTIEDANSGKNDVGFIDLTNEKVINVTGPARGAFSVTPDYERPFFRPETDDLWFRAYGGDWFVVTVMPDGTFSEAKEGTVPENRWTGDARGLDTNPSGTTSVIFGTDPLVLYVYENGGRRVGNQIEAQKEIHVPGVQWCSEETWVDDFSFVCYADSRTKVGADNSVWIVTLAQDHKSATSRRILPPNDRRSSDFLVSPDDHQIAFKSRAVNQNVWEVFVITVDQASEPKALGAIGPTSEGFRLLVWN